MAHVDHPHHQAFIPRLQNAAVPLCGERARLMCSLPAHPDTELLLTPLWRHSQKPEAFRSHTLPKAVYVELGFFFHPLR